MNLDLIYSRPQKTAEGLAGLAVDHHRFLTKKVLLTGEAPTLATSNGAQCFLDAIRLLIRICPNIVINVPDGRVALLQAARAITDQMGFGSAVEYRDLIKDFGSFDAILSVGVMVRADLPWTTINSNGWLARVSSVDTNLPADTENDNPIGALAAACLGAGEVFKRLIALKPERGELLNGFSFSLRTYRADDADAGPQLPDSLTVDLLMVGAGAIGNGLAHLLSRLAGRGRIHVVDSQDYGEENLGTCIMIGPHEVGRAKARAMASLLSRPDLDVQGFVMPFDQYAEQQSDTPALVINGLDNIPGRHDVQRLLWPDLVVDGAIGDFTCQVSRHPWPDDVACLMCLFREPSAVAAETVQKRATGLSLDRLRSPEALVRESDVANAPVERRKFLRSRVGRSVCAVVQEGIALQISSERLATSFAPSVPFTACFSACMVMAEAVASIAHWQSALAPRFQFDFLIGPGRGQDLPQARRPNCICARAKNIERVRRAVAERRNGLYGEMPMVSDPAA
jgi:molybdopterin/thiamine biosynthesis adenylyltransferase